MERYRNLDLEASLLENEEHAACGCVCSTRRRARARRRRWTCPRTCPAPAYAGEAQLALAELIPLGETLGNLLLPPAARSRLEVSLARLDDDERLRIRLRFDL